MAADDDSGRFKLVRQIFEAALDLPVGERAAFLDDECAGDAGIRTEVEQLLSCDEEEGDLASLLDRGADLLVSAAKPGNVAGPHLPSGGRVGPFTLRRVLGSGGMGTVYEAEQDEPRRSVALKVLSLGLANEQAVRRFKWEAEVLANLRHPAIAQVHAVGVHQAGKIELPWFAMELVPGALDLMSYAQQHALSIPDRLRKLLEVCDAVHHGHLQGVVHRDLKPQNVLIDERGRVKVIDFGIARSMAKDLELTDQGIVLGTLHYMSPEQLRGGKIDLRTDIYALGVVAFELIAGRRPFVFDETTPLIVAETVENQDAPRLSTVVRGVGRDLEVVVQKALRRDAADRYASVGEFAEDLRAYLEARPVRARAPSTFYQVRMFARRRAGLVASATVILLLMLVGVIVTLVHNSELVASERVSARVARFMRDFLEEASLEAGNGADYTVREALDVAAANLELENFEDPEIEAQLRELLGTVYLDLSLPEVAEAHLRRAQELWLQIEGDQSENAMGVALSLVVSLREQGRVPAAEELVESLDAAYGNTALADDARYWEVQHNRAYVMRHVGKLKDAEVLFREVLAARERLLGLDDYATIVTMHNLGTLMLNLRRPEDARDVLAAALERCERSDHPVGSTLQIADNLAQAWGDLGELHKAAARHREAMQGFEDLMGPDNHLTIGCGYHLLKVLHKQGKHGELETLAKDLLTRCERTFGEDDYRTMDVLQALAVAMSNRGAVTEAAGMMTRAYDAVVRGRGEVHPATFNAGHNLTETRIAAQDKEGALQITEHLTTLLNQDPDPAPQLPPPFPGLTWLLRARALALAERPAEAATAAQKAVELLQPIVEADDKLLVEARKLAASN